MSDVLDELQAISAALTGDRELLERRREREALAKEREELAESQRRIELVLLEASKPKPRSLTRIAGVVGGVALLVAASVGIGAAIVERRAPDPVADTLEPLDAALVLASHELESLDDPDAAANAVNYLELARSHAGSSPWALRRVATQALEVGHALDATGIFPLESFQSFDVARSCFVEIGDRRAAERAGTLAKQAFTRSSYQSK